MCRLRRHNCSRSNPLKPDTGAESPVRMPSTCMREGDPSIGLISSWRSDPSALGCLYHCASNRRLQWNRTNLQDGREFAVRIWGWTTKLVLVGAPEGHRQIKGMLRANMKKCAWLWLFISGEIS